MKILQRALVFFTVLLVLASAVITAFAKKTESEFFQSYGATTMNKCQIKETTKKAHRQGILSGQSIVRQAWNSLNQHGNSCQNADRLFDLIQDNLRRFNASKKASDYVKCRYAGTVFGAYMELKTVFKSCYAQANPNWTEEFEKLFATEW